MRLIVGWRIGFVVRSFLVGDRGTALEVDGRLLDLRGDVGDVGERVGEKTEGVKGSGEVNSEVGAVSVLIVVIIGCNSGFIAPEVSSGGIIDFLGSFPDSSAITSGGSSDPSDFNICLDEDEDEDDAFLRGLILLSTFAFPSPSRTTHKNPTHLPRLHSCRKLISSQNCSIVRTFFQPWPLFALSLASSLPSSSKNLAFGSSGKCGITSRTVISASASSLYGWPFTHCSCPAEGTGGSSGRTSRRSKPGTMRYPFAPPAPEEACSCRIGSRTLHHQAISPLSVRTCFFSFTAEFGKRYCVCERAKREIVAVIEGSASRKELKRCLTNAVAMVRSVDLRSPVGVVKDASSRERYPLLSALLTKNVLLPVLAMVYISTSIANTRIPSCEIDRKWVSSVVVGAF